jgi:hypothetical protein
VAQVRASLLKQAFRRSRARLWWLVCALALALVGWSSAASSQQRPRLVVYLLTSVKPHALETALSRQMPAVDITVCSRYRDFVALLATQPDASLALEPVLAEHGFARDVRGVRAGQDNEPYVLLAVGTTIDPSQFGKISVGTVDLLGRERTGKLVARLLGLAHPPQVKYVIKTEDLLPLLQFRFADAALLPEAEAARIKSVSKLDLRVTPVSVRVGLPAVSFHSEAGRSLVRPAIFRLDAETNRKLGVDAWR